MFFAPPQVKSLSRYSEFGTYLHFRHFLITVMLALAIHASIIGFYAMMPREEVVRIPVRVLNIKLGSEGLQIEAPVPLAPAAPAPAIPAAEAIQPLPSAAKIRIEEEKPPKAAETSTDKPVPHTPPLIVKIPRPATPAEKAHALASAESRLSTPKKYVRESDMAGAGHGKGRGGSAMGSASGDEIIERYEQTISLWIASHKIYPYLAKQQGIEGDAVVRIRINREGHILYNAIDRSSGNALIDQAVINMVRSSDPVPVVPADYPTANQLEFLIPVSFRLQ